MFGSQMPRRTKPPRLKRRLRRPRRRSIFLTRRHAEPAWRARSSSSARDELFDDEVRSVEDAGIDAPAGQRRPGVDRSDSAVDPAPSGPHLLSGRNRVRGGVGSGRPRSGLALPARPEGIARPERAQRADPGRAGHDLLRADHLLLRACSHGVAFAGVAAHHPVDGRSCDAACRARNGGARIDRHGRTGDPA